MRFSRQIKIEDPDLLKRRLLQWAQQFQEVAWLDSNNSGLKYSKFDALLAVEAFTAIKSDVSGAFDQLQEYQDLTSDWLFGYLSYDLKNDTEDLISENFDGLSFPEIYFFQPKKIFLLKKNILEVQYLNFVDDELEADLKEIFSTEIPPETPSAAGQKSEIKARISREEYLRKVKKMQEYIQRGDIYEANFCQEFYCENVELNPEQTFQHLNSVSNPPFATFLKIDQHYLFSASPERYLKKEGSKIISQPIKGTAPRGKNKEEDDFLINQLKSDPKERSENIMIVDLVRNDLSKTAKRGSVEVEELCEIYSFPQVHQMISTVKAEVEERIPPVEILRYTFPMGSMTGAPKISAMKIIEELEETKRGLYSGAVGYFTPDDDFDFNVVIRSILYNKKNKYASFSVGGAITAQSVPEKEYEECLLKAKAMREVLEGAEKAEN